MAVDVQKIIEETDIGYEKYNTPAWKYYRQHAKPYKECIDFEYWFKGAASVLGFFMILPVYVVVLRFLQNWHFILAFTCATVIYVFLGVPLFLLATKLGTIATEKYAEKISHYNKLVDDENNHLKELLGIRNKE